MVANINVQKVPWGISNIQSFAGICFFFSKLNDRDERISVCIFCVLGFIVKAYILRFACTAFLGENDLFAYCKLRQMDSHRILSTQVILGIEIGGSIPLPIVIEYRADHWLRIELRHLCGTILVGGLSYREPEPSAVVDGKTTVVSDLYFVCDSLSQDTIVIAVFTKASSGTSDSSGLVYLFRF